MPGDHQLAFTFPYCHHWTTPGINAEVAEQRALHREDGDGSYPLLEQHRAWRNTQCIAPYHLTPHLHMEQREHWPLSWALMNLSGGGMQLAMSDRKLVTTTIDGLIRAARDYSPSDWNSLSPRVLHAFYMPISPLAPETHRVLSTPGLVFYRAAIVDAWRRVRVRAVDHNHVIAMLDAWRAEFDRQLGMLGGSVKEGERQCVCPAHMSLFGTGMMFHYEPSKRTWRILLDLVVLNNSTMMKYGQPLAPQPPYAIHPFPAAIDITHLTDAPPPTDDPYPMGGYVEYGPGRIVPLSPPLSLRYIKCCYHMMMNHHHHKHASRFILVLRYTEMPPSRAALEAALHATRGDDHDATDMRFDMKADEAVMSPMAMARMPPSLEEKIRTIYRQKGGEGGGEAPYLAQPLPLTAFPRQRHEMSPAGMRCHLYCQRLEQWMMIGPAPPPPPPIPPLKQDEV